LSGSVRAVSASAANPASSHPTELGAMGGPVIGTWRSQGRSWNDRRDATAQRVRPSRQSAMPSIAGAGPTAASAISMSSSSLLCT
jgi:hypothetical protein